MEVCMDAEDKLEEMDTEEVTVEETTEVIESDDGSEVDVFGERIVTDEDGYILEDELIEVDLMDDTTEDKAEETA